MEGEVDYIPIATLHQNDFCMKIGIDDSRFNVSLTARDKVTTQCPKTTTFEEKLRRAELGIRTEVLLLTSLAPYRQAKPAHRRQARVLLLLR